MPSKTVTRLCILTMMAKGLIAIPDGQQKIKVQSAIQPIAVTLRQGNSQFITLGQSLQLPSYIKPIQLPSAPDLKFPLTPNGQQPKFPITLNGQQPKFPDKGSQYLHKLKQIQYQAFGVNNYGIKNVDKILEYPNKLKELHREYITKNPDVLDVVQKNGEQQAFRRISIQSMRGVYNQIKQSGASQVQIQQAARVLFLRLRDPLPGQLQDGEQQYKALQNGLQGAEQIMKDPSRAQKLLGGMRKMGSSGFKFVGKNVGLIMIGAIKLYLTQLAISLGYQAVSWGWQQMWAFIQTTVQHGLKGMSNFVNHYGVNYGIRADLLYLRMSSNTPKQIKDAIDIMINDPTISRDMNSPDLRQFGFYLKSVNPKARISHKQVLQSIQKYLSQRTVQQNIILPRLVSTIATSQQSFSFTREPLVNSFLADMSHDQLFKYVDTFYKETVQKYQTKQNKIKQAQTIINSTNNIINSLRTQIQNIRQQHPKLQEYPHFENLRPTGNTFSSISRFLTDDQMKSEVRQTYKSLLFEMAFAAEQYNTQFQYLKDLKEQNTYLETLYQFWDASSLFLQTSKQIFKQYVNRPMYAQHVNLKKKLLKQLLFDQFIIEKFGNQFIKLSSTKLQFFKKLIQKIKLQTTDEQQILIRVKNFMITQMLTNMRGNEFNLILPTEIQSHQVIFRSISDKLKDNPLQFTFNQNSANQIYVRIRTIADFQDVVTKIYFNQAISANQKQRFFAKFQQFQTKAYQNLETLIQQYTGPMVRSLQQMRFQRQVIQRLIPSYTTQKQAQFAQYIRDNNISLPNEQTVQKFTRLVTWYQNLSQDVSKQLTNLNKVFQQTGMTQLIGKSIFNQPVPTHNITVINNALSSLQNQLQIITKPNFFGQIADFLKDYNYKQFEIFYFKNPDTIEWAKKLHSQGNQTKLVYQSNEITINIFQQYQTGKDYTSSLFQYDPSRQVLFLDPNMYVALHNGGFKSQLVTNQTTEQLSFLQQQYPNQYARMTSGTQVLTINPERIVQLPTIFSLQTINALISKSIRVPRNTSTQAVFQGLTPQLKQTVLNFKQQIRQSKSGLIQQGMAKDAKDLEMDGVLRSSVQNGITSVGWGIFSAIKHFFLYNPAYLAQFFVKNARHVAKWLIQDLFIFYLSPISIGKYPLLTPLVQPISGNAIIGQTAVKWLAPLRNFVVPMTLYSIGSTITQAYSQQISNYLGISGVILSSIYFYINAIWFGYAFLSLLKQSMKGLHSLIMLAPLATGVAALSTVNQLISKKFEVQTLNPFYYIRQFLYKHKSQLITVPVKWLLKVLLLLLKSAVGFFKLVYIVLVKILQVIVPGAVMTLAMLCYAIIIAAHYICTKTSIVYNGYQHSLPIIKSVLQQIKNQFSTMNLNIYAKLTSIFSSRFSSLKQKVNFIQQAQNTHKIILPLVQNGNVKNACLQLTENQIKITKASNQQEVLQQQMQQQMKQLSPQQITDVVIQTAQQLSNYLGKNAEQVMNQQEKKLLTAYHISQISQKNTVKQQEISNIIKQIQKQQKQQTKKKKKKPQTKARVLQAKKNKKIKGQGYEVIKISKQQQNQHYIQQIQQKPDNSQQKYQIMQEQFSITQNQGNENRKQQHQSLKRLLISPQTTYIDKQQTQTRNKKPNKKYIDLMAKKQAKKLKKSQKENQKKKNQKIKQKKQSSNKNKNIKEKTHQLLQQFQKVPQLETIQQKVQQQIFIQNQLDEGNQNFFDPNNIDYEQKNHQFDIQKSNNQDIINENDNMFTYITEETAKTEQHMIDQFQLQEQQLIELLQQQNTIQQIANISIDTEKLKQLNYVPKKKQIRKIIDKTINQQIGSKRIVQEITEKIFQRVIQSHQSIDNTSKSEQKQILSPEKQVDLSTYSLFNQNETFKDKYRDVYKNQQVLNLKADIKPQLDFIFNEDNVYGQKYLEPLNQSINQQFNIVNNGKFKVKKINDVLTSKKQRQQINIFSQKMSVPQTEYKPSTNNKNKKKLSRQNQKIQNNNNSVNNSNNNNNNPINPNMDRAAAKVFFDQFLNKIKKATNTKIAFTKGCEFQTKFSEAVKKYIDQRGSNAMITSDLKNGLINRINQSQEQIQLLTKQQLFATFQWIYKAQDIPGQVIVAVFNYHTNRGNLVQNTQQLKQTNQQMASAAIIPIIRGSLTGENNTIYKISVKLQQKTILQNWFDYDYETAFKTFLSVVNLLKVYGQVLINFQWLYRCAQQKKYKQRILLYSSYAPELNFTIFNGNAQVYLLNSNKQYQYIPPVNMNMNFLRYILKLQYKKYAQGLIEQFNRDVSTEKYQTFASTFIQPLKASYTNQRLAILNIKKPAQKSFWG